MDVEGNDVEGKTDGISGIGADLTGTGTGSDGSGSDRTRGGVQGSESGMTTAELLGNAALGIAALVAIWALLQALGVNVINWIEGQLGI
ncbi:MAG: hypothetical protein R3A49_04195 [Acidimicrobiia bacterium]